MNQSLIKLLTDYFELITRLETNFDFEKDDTVFKRHLIQDLKSTKELFKQRKAENLSVFRKNFYLENLCLQFIIFLHLNLLTIIFEKILDNSFEDMEPGSFSYKSIAALIPNLSNLINSLLAIRITLQHGFNIQANQLLRSYIEYADIGVAIVSNEEFFEKYKTMVDGSEQEKEVWWNYVRHKSITKIIKNSLFDIHPDEEYWDILFQIRKPIYKNSSDHIHGHSGINLFGLHATPFEDESDSKFALGGYPSKEMKETFMHIIIYSHQFMSNIAACFVHFHDLPFMKFGEEGEDFTRNLKISEYFQKLIINLNIDRDETYPAH